MEISNAVSGCEKRNGWIRHNDWQIRFRRTIDDNRINEAPFETKGRNRSFREVE